MTISHSKQLGLWFDDHREDELWLVVLCVRSAALGFEKFMVIFDYLHHALFNTISVQT
jgi:hypothetical protein